MNISQQTRDEIVQLYSQHIPVRKIMSRSIGESEVPEIQRAFETTLRQLEKKYKDNDQGRGDHE